MRSKRTRLVESGAFVIERGRLKKRGGKEEQEEEDEEQSPSIRSKCGVFSVTLLSK